jgi:hypothetical protein
MAELDAGHFEDLCREAPVQAQIDTVEDKRREAVRRFWLILVPGLLLSVLVAIIGVATDHVVVGTILCIVGIVACIVLGASRIQAVGQGIKLPVLESLAARAGLEFLADGFDPPVFDEARTPLFGGWLSACVFTDLFHGADPDGKRFAVYEGVLSQGQGKHRREVFRGQIYAFERRRSASGSTVAVPDRKWFNVFKPSGGYERVKFENDAAFEKHFEVYSTYPAEASMLMGGPDVRALLLRLRESGRVFVHLGPTDALVAVTGTDRFEPGGMFRSMSGEARVRLMFDDICASLTTLKALRRTFG